MENMIMRKLATVRRIDEILPIEGADLIVLVKIDGWACVAKSEEFKPGDPCVYFEIDSFLPDEPIYAHLRARTFRKMGEKEGLRIKTIKLRGQLSQGLALPCHLFFDRFVDSKYDEGQELCEFFSQGADLTDFLCVEKFELPIPLQLAGKVSGNFPAFIPKTDQERCQNLGIDIFVHNKDSKYEVTMKMDGTSFTAYRFNEVDGVCGRNWNLKLDDSNSTNSLVRMYIDSGLQDVLLKYGKNLAVQGELMGPGIQQNREKFVTHKLFIFDIYDIDKGEHLSPEDRRNTLAELHALGLKKEMVDHVPIIAYTANLFDTLGITTTDQLLKFAEGPSIVHAIREGLVFKRVDGKFSFKAISNKFLLKEEE
jgi:RNA ligase (TIGR02306 family)